MRRSQLWQPTVRKVARPKTFLNVPLVAVTAFNLAYSTYWPPDVKVRRLVPLLLLLLHASSR